MAKQQLSTISQTPTELTISKEEFITALDERINIGEDIYTRQINSMDIYKKSNVDYSNWNDYNSEFLKYSFNKEENEYKTQYINAGLFPLNMLHTVGKSQKNELTRFKDKVYSKLDNLKKLRAKTNLLRTSIQEKIIDSEKSISLDKSQVFIVHGHDDSAKSKTARFIEKLGLSPIILHEQASGSKTVIEKIETYSNVGFGIILYTPCDIGAKNEPEPNIKNRARQNVVFEHGFLIGKIGRKNVCALVKGDIETPNDISGVVYVNMDDDEAWHLKVARELRNSGYEIDMNKL